MVICSKCKHGEIKENISFNGILFNIKKVITSYCSCCDYEKVNIFPSSLTERQNYYMRRNL